MISDSARKILGAVPKPMSLFFIWISHNLRSYKKIKDNFGIIDDYRRRNLKGENFKADEKLIENFKKFIVYFDKAGAQEFIDSYLGGGKLICKKKNEYVVDNIILICCVKDDLKRIKAVYEYHKALGIEHMVFIDNDSSDGTLEFLMGLDVDVYWTDESYATGIKTAWVRKIQDIYGYNRWYLIVDSDELFSYVGMENHNITEFVYYLTQRGYKRAGAVMLDMYSSHELYKDNEKDFVREYRFFDDDSYIETNDGKGRMIRGGPRKRVFQTGKNFSEALGKIPMIYAEEEDLWTDHQPIPFQKNYNIPILSVLRHYKFMEGDNKKYREIVQTQKYHNNSFTYKTYLENEDIQTMYYDKACEYRCSESLSVLPFLESIDWNSKVE
ncbi:glycosyltransferase family 2 protein [Butyrivibrio sp. XPD2002]|uniref:glycosyltransferase family 2 protein n=1 Tax=Butyrivibrio sp. XPD2002 TaxID=1280665 RepID=UPI00041E4340|nr:glycosyltransferase family 2 protein [Butyrivibrio sp. XPD2002]